MRKGTKFTKKQKENHAKAIKNRKYKKKICVICATSFQPNNGIQKRCSDSCQKEKERLRSRFRYYNERGYKEQMFRRAREWQKSQRGLDYIYEWQRKKNGTWQTPCEICGEKRFTQRCHIVPRHKNGNDEENNILYLCPTHHVVLDNLLIKKRGNLFTKKEFNKIKHRLKT